VARARERNVVEVDVDFILAGFISVSDSLMHLFSSVTFSLCSDFLLDILCKLVQMEMEMEVVFL